MSLSTPPFQTPHHALTSWPPRSLYGGGNGSIAIRFGDDPDIYDFPKGLLTSYFLYFRLALRTHSDTGEAVFAEGDSQQVLHLEDVDIAAFATLHRWVSAHATDGSNPMSFFWIWAEPAEKDVGHLLRVAVAADYLGLDCFAELEEWLNQGFALSVLEDRRVVTQEVLDMIREHSAFRSGLLWRTIAKAGVRPALQEYVLALPDGEGHGCGHKDGFVEWEKVLKYCRELRGRKGNAEYAAAVLEEITATLLAGSLRGQRTGLGGVGALVYRDPLREVYAEKPYQGGNVDYDFSM